MNWCANFANSLDIGVPWIMCQESDAPTSVVIILFIFLNYIYLIKGIHTYELICFLNYVY